jgi:hypothetical protein
MIFTNETQGCRRFPGGSARPRFLISAAILTLAMAPAQAQATQGKPQPSTRLPATVPASGVQTGIDAFAPFLYTSPTAGSQVWTIAHHGNTSQSAPRVSCVNRTTGALCTAPNGSATTWPKSLNLTSGPLGTGNTGNLATTETPQYVRGSSVNILYYPVVTSTAVTGFPNGSVGAGCLNLLTQSNCGYTPLAALTNTAGQANVNGLTGFVQVGANAYGTLTTGQEVCFAVATAAPCAGQPYTTDSPPSNDAAGIGPSDYFGTTTAINSRVYIASNGPDSRTRTPHPPTISCFDPATNAPCTGWTPKVISDPNSYLTLSLSPLNNTSGTATGICAVTGRTTTAAPSVNCWDPVTGAIVPPPANLTGLFPAGSARSVIFQAVTANVGGNIRTYWPMYSEDHTRPGTTLCYNWTSGAPCGVYPINHPTVNGGDTHDYGYVYASDTGCMYGAGDPGYLFSFYSTTGVAGC